MSTPIIIGIDPGKSTGYAEWDRIERKLCTCESMAIDEAMDRVRAAHQSGVVHSVVFEDARLRTWLGSKGKEALQGAGSIKRDCTIWADFLGRIGVAYVNVSPQAGATKWSSAKFAQLTGWPGRTNEHARDAALLVLGRK